MAFWMSSRARSLFTKFEWLLLFCCVAPWLRARSSPLRPSSGCWRDAVREARWGLEYLDLLGDIWASELTSQWYYIRENIKTCSGWEVKKDSHVYVYIYIYIYIHTSLSLYIYIYIDIYTHTSLSLYIYIYIYAYNTYMCIYIYIYIYIYTHVVMHASPPACSRRRGRAAPPAHLIYARSTY